jgi:hypothetical protein
MGFLGITLVTSDKEAGRGTPGKHTLNLSCSISPDNVLDFVGNLARIHRTSCSFSPDDVLDFKRIACSISPDMVLDFSRCTQKRSRKVTSSAIYPTLLRISGEPKPARLF